MRKSLILILAAFLIQPVFAADQDMDRDSKPCAEIAKACLDAGYTRNGEGSKMFWKDCMKPLVLGETVNGVTTIDANTVKMCRSDKIAKMKKELQELQKAFNNNGNTNGKKV